LGYFSFTLPGVLIDFKGVTKGISYGSGKNKKKNKEKQHKE
jgi:hypothetical protein